MELILFYTHLRFSKLLELGNSFSSRAPGRMSWFWILRTVHTFAWDSSSAMMYFNFFYIEIHLSYYMTLTSILTRYNVISSVLKVQCEFYIHIYSDSGFGFVATLLAMNTDHMQMLAWALWLIKTKRFVLTHRFEDLPCVNVYKLSLWRFWS